MTAWKSGMRNTSKICRGTSNVLPSSAGARHTVFDFSITHTAGRSQLRRLLNARWLLA